MLTWIEWFASTKIRSPKTFFEYLKEKESRQSFSKKKGQDDILYLGSMKYERRHKTGPKDYREKDEVQSSNG